MRSLEPSVARGMASLVFVGDTLLAACSGGSDVGSAASCPPANTYCAGCNGGGFCAPTCPGFDCPASADGGGSDAAIGAADGGGCPPGSPTYCTDCNGGGFCVAGSCPATTCPRPTLDAAPDASRVDDAGNTLCTTSSDCSNFEVCSPGGAISGCGACLPPENPCAMDSDCARIGDAATTVPMVCGPGGPCNCSQLGKSGSCIPACQSDSECGAQEACQSGHCVVKPCSSDAQCNPVGVQDYGCFGGSCLAKGCASAADCHGDYCVNGGCSQQPGICVQLPS